jgi:hypothetical protein
METKKLALIILKQYPAVVEEDQEVGIFKIKIHVFV